MLEDLPAESTIKNKFFMHIPDVIQKFNEYQVWKLIQWEKISYYSSKKKKNRKKEDISYQSKKFLPRFLLSRFPQILVHSEGIKEKKGQCT